MTSALGGIAAAALAIAMIAMFACVIGGVWMIVKRGDRKKGALMLVMAVVLLGNVLIWTM
jgi:FtsH-binding integral membrane protein